MAFCSNCGTQYNEGAKFCPRCGQPTDFVSQQRGNQFQQSNGEYQHPQQQYVVQQPQGQYASQQPIKPDSNMIMAILSTLFCCLPTGIYAIILANKVDKLYYAGEYNEAEEASNGAKKWSIIGAVIGFIAVVIYWVFLFLVGFDAGYNS